MPTEPLDGLLDREFAKKGARKLVEQACPLLRELVNESTRVFSRCEQSDRRAEDGIDLPAFLLFRHLIELVDSIEVQLRHVCVEATVPTLRAAFEASVSLDYLLKDDEHYRYRSLCWIYAYATKRADRLELYDPSTEKGKQYRSKWREEGMGDPPEVTEEQLEEIENLRSVCEGEEFEEVAKEYEKLTDERTGRTPNWYALFGGPSHLRQLAERVDRRSEYDTYYKGWSATVHGTELLQYVHGPHPDHEDRTIFNSIRHPDAFPRRTTVSANLLLHGIRMMLEHFRPEEDVEPWYRREVRERYRKLSRTTVEPVPVTP